MSEHAFPANHFDLADNEHGMTLRDYFAANALPHVYTCLRATTGVGAAVMAAIAYQLADAMLAERNKQ